VVAIIPDMQVPKLREAAIELKNILRPESEEDGKIVQKGLMLYRQGLVHHMKYVGGSIWATVQDVTPVRVYVSFPNPADSTCTCPYEGFCRHQMAAFFQAYAQVNNVADWVEEWRQPLKESQKAEQWGLEKAKELIRQDPTNGEYGYNLWAENFKQSFQEIMLGQGDPTPYVISSLLHTYLRSLRASAPHQQEWKTLYELIGKFYAFKQLAALSEELGHSSRTIDRYYRYLFETLVEDIEDLTSSLSVHSVPFDFDPYMEGLKQETAELIETVDQFDYERVSMYRMLWGNLLKNTSWREAERARLESFEAEKRTGLEDIALAHQYFLARRDKATIEQVKSLGTSSLPFLFYWIDELTSQGDLNRAGDYVDYLSQHLRTALVEMENHQAARDFTRLVLRTTAPYFRENGREDHYERMLTQSLPYSFIEYEDFLFVKGQYDKWGELYTYANFDSFSVPNDKIKIVQKENPEVLLPILHQAVDALIIQKNRASYKQAVRLLKKLRTIYKKLKRVPEWETFLNKLLDRYKRLRAFNEECKRGKLIE
jgi:hypothetical protein